MHLVKTNIYTVIIQTCNTEGVQINKIRPLFFYYSNEGVLRSAMLNKSVFANRTPGIIRKENNDRQWENVGP